jgi:hypothetical protein
MPVLLLLMLPLLLLLLLTLASLKLQQLLTPLVAKLLLLLKPYILLVLQIAILRQRDSCSQFLLLLSELQLAARCSLQRSLQIPRLLPRC